MTTVAARRASAWTADASPVALGAVALAALAVVAGALTTDEFLSIENLKVILRSAALVGILAVGLTFVTISGNYFLLSMEEMAGLASISFASFIGWGWGLWPAALATLAIAAAVGMLQGVVVGLGANPIVVTLGAAGVIFGIGSVLSDNSVILMQRPHPAQWIGTGQPLGVPTITWAFLLFAALSALLLRKTRFGRSTYLVGANRATARSAGFRATSKAVQVFALASAASGLVGILFTAQISQGQINLFSAGSGSSGSLTISAIAAVLVGGTAIAGGYGSVLRTVLGALFIAVIDNMMVLRGFQSAPRILFVGLTVVVGVSLYALLHRGRR